MFYDLCYSCRTWAKVVPQNILSCITFSKACVSLPHLFLSYCLFTQVRCVTYCYRMYRAPSIWPMTVRIFKPSFPLSDVEMTTFSFWFKLYASNPTQFSFFLKTSLSVRISLWYCRRPSLEEHFDWLSSLLLSYWTLSELILHESLMFFYFGITKCSSIFTLLI